jgi:hypothetical protein
MNSTIPILSGPCELTLFQKSDGKVIASESILPYLNFARASFMQGKPTPYLLWDDSGRLMTVSVEEDEQASFVPNAFSLARSMKLPVWVTVCEYEGAEPSPNLLMVVILNEKEQWRADVYAMVSQKPRKVGPWRLKQPDGMPTYNAEDLL